MEAYQAIYDAVRSKISGGNIAEAVADAARSAFDISHVIGGLAQDIAHSVAQHARPSAVYRPEVSLDGAMYCLLYGKDLMSGVAGFGRTMEAAALDFDKNWSTLNAPKPQMSADGGKDIPL